MPRYMTEMLGMFLENRDISIPQEVMARLLEAGRIAGEGDMGQAEALLEKLQSHEELRETGPSFWKDYLGCLGPKTIPDLVRGLALLGNMPGWAKSSGRILSLVFGHLLAMDFEGVLPLAEGIMKQHPNTCFQPDMEVLREKDKTQKIRAENRNMLRKLQDIMGPAACEAAHGAWMRMTLDNSKALVREKEGLEKRLLAALKELEKQEKRLKKQNKALESHIADRERQLEYRKKYRKERESIRNSAHLSPAERLTVVARNPGIPTALLPEDWACTDSGILSALDPETRHALKNKLSKQRSGPWRTVYKALAAMEAGGCDA